MLTVASLLLWFIVVAVQCATDAIAIEHHYNNDTSTMTITPVMSAYDLQCLSELPLEQLLKIQKSLHIVTGMTNDAGEPDLMQYEERIGAHSMARNEAYIFDTSGNNETITAQPFIFDKIKEKVGYEETWVEEKPSKVQKIFQLSVTTLAFLAFGGYLLCMIVQAIKSKGTTYYHPALMPMQTAPAASQVNYKKRRPGRSRRAAHNELKFAGPSPEDMYRILVLAAEGYVGQNQV